jgi:hypothetical protein
LILNGFILASVTVTGFYVIWKKFPRKIRKFLEKHSLMTDLIACLLTYSFLGGTLTALFASAIVGLMVSMLLEISQNSDNYLYLFDAVEKIKELLNSMRQSLNNYGSSYKASKFSVLEEHHA